MFKKIFKKKPKEFNSGKVIIPVGHPNPPAPHEVDVAKILATHYKTTVEFIMPIDDYKRKTPDIKMHGVLWEIKTPKGKAKSTISNQLRRGSKQSGNLIIDTRHTKIKYIEIERRIIFGVSNSKSIKKVILLNKSGKVVELLM